ncbi:MAG: response regulator [Thermoanaerobaculia bacterium]
MDMNRLVAPACLLSLALALSTPAPACGDKFVFIGSGAQLTTASLAKHPGRVLVFANPKTGFSAISQDVRGGLRRAGHRVLVLDSIQALGEALRSGSPDVILADIEDVVDVAALLKDAPGKPGLLPVVYHKEPGDLEALKVKYSCLVAPKKGRDADLFVMVNEALESRARGVVQGCAPKA